MRKIRLRTKFLLSLLTISAGLTTATLVVVSYNVKNRVRASISEDLRNSVHTYNTFERERAIALIRSAELLANLPNVRALMTTQDTATIQEEASSIWRLSGSDLLVFANRQENVAAIRSTANAFTAESAEQLLRNSLEKGEQRDWWFGRGYLYEVYIQPIYFGIPSENTTIGFLAVGHGIDRATALDFGKLASSEVVFRSGDFLVANTLTGTKQSDFVRLSPQRLASRSETSEETLGGERYLLETVGLPPEGSARVTLTILKSFDKATAFLRQLNRVLLILGIVSVLAGGALVFLISHTVTRPLANLVAGVRALQDSNFDYPLGEHEGDEVAEVTGAFSRMRANLQKTQDEQRLLEERLRQAHKMEAVGRLAGGVAHDFNNLLTVIRGNSDLLMDRVGSENATRRYVEQIQKAASRAVSMTRQLLAFSRMQALQPVVLDLNNVVLEMGKMLPRLIGEHVEYIFLPDPQLKMVKADPGQIELVILNLAVNARDAMPQGGILKVQTSNVVMDEVQASKRPPMSAGGYVALSVIDTGHGMDEKTRTHIFEPFFTTKESGKGTGLGLATVYGIVKQSGGFIWVESAPGQGTTFEIYLPQVQSSVAELAVEPITAQLSRGTETILVVEDEPDVRDLACQFLSSRGFEVLEAKDGFDALEVLARYSSKIDLVLSDMLMPRMSGVELYKQVQAARPHTKVVFMSGYSEYSGQDLGQTPLLQKPFSQPTLVEFVRSALSGDAFEKLSTTKKER